MLGLKALANRNLTILVVTLTLLVGTQSLMACSSTGDEESTRSSTSSTGAGSSTTESSTTSSEPAGEAVSTSTTVTAAGASGDLSPMDGHYRRVTATSPCRESSTGTTVPPPPPWLFGPSCEPSRKIDAFSFVVDLTIQGDTFSLWRGYGPDGKCEGGFSNVGFPAPNSANVTFTNVICSSRSAPDVTTTLELVGTIGEDAGTYSEDTLLIEGAPYERVP